MSDPNDRAARAERWRRLRPHLSETFLEGHDRKARELREARTAKREADLKAMVDEAIHQALTPALISRAFTEAAPPAPLTESAHSVSELSETPMHQMSEEKWHELRSGYWSQRLPQHSRGPMTIGELIAGRTGDDDGTR